MFERFVSAYRSDLPLRGEIDESSNSTVNEFLKNLGGYGFNNGIYRLFSPSSLEAWDALVSRAFPEFRTHIRCFGVDWLGRVFALDGRRLVGNAPGVVMFEPGTGEALEVPCNIVTFHEEELIDYREEALAESFYLQWISSGGRVPLVGQCVGYKRPLFLGGSDLIENLEISDLDVYWEISAEVIRQARNSPMGSAIGNISIN